MLFWTITIFKRSSANHAKICNSGQKQSCGDFRAYNLMASFFIIHYLKPLKNEGKPILLSAHYLLHLKTISANN